VTTLRGLSTVTFWADDIEAAKKWYSEFLGFEPYFERGGGYVEYRIGDFEHELGIIDRRYAPKNAARKPGGVVVYWHVDNVEKTVARLTEMGAKEYEPVTEREDGFVTAAVVDPFGNILGVMYSPHYLDEVAEHPAKHNGKRK
jgi:predicted enzyme related to lactoylglutathione lyase